MTQILSPDLAQGHCQTLITYLDHSELGNKLKQSGQGRMFGVLVCTDGTILYAISGDMDSTSDFAFVPPVYDVSQYRAILSKYDFLINRNPDHQALSRQCWQELKNLYHFTCYDGLKRSLNDVFPKAPSGTGDCCAPRLLSYAYSLGKKPLSISEFFYGSGTQPHLSFHGPCDQRCKPLMPSLIGLDIIYRDNDIVVVNKPSGVLSIEGRGPDKQDCIASRVKSFFPSCIAQPCVHRLDQATSGLIVLSLTKQAHDKLSLDFENRKVKKEYLALVDGLILEETGTIDLPIRLDIDNRPKQVVDIVHGKHALTVWQRLCIENRYGRKVTRLRLIPQTGRTHQLRIHCAQGLGHPILGDAIYGTAPSAEIPRLMLQAKMLDFIHPTTGKAMHFQLEDAF